MDSSLDIPYMKMTACDVPNVVLATYRLEVAILAGTQILDVLARQVTLVDMILLPINN
jgi:hypothetical protein